MNSKIIMGSPQQHRARALGLMLAAMFTLQAAVRTEAQDAPQGWDTGVATPAAPETGTTTIERSTDAEKTAPADAATALSVKFVALLTADGQRIDQGLVWRVYLEEDASGLKTRLLSTHRDAAPALKLAPATYVVNAAFGRAHLTRRIIVKQGGAAPAIEQFVLNAGGLRITAQLSGALAPPNSVNYAIYSDRDQQDNRKLIMSGAKPGLIIRLNAGIYHIVSTYGDANASVRSDVTVEAGKLTEATLAHTAAKATFKLVTRTGGEALPDTQWSIQTPEGEVVKESVGALPTHILAPGSYIATAKSQSGAYQRAFTLKDGETAEVEVMMQ